MKLHYKNLHVVFEANGKYYPLNSARIIDEDEIKRKIKWFKENKGALAHDSVKADDSYATIEFD